MQSQTQERSGYGFAIGLLAGTCVGAGLAMWLAPRSAAAARRLGEQVADQYQQIRIRVSEAVDDVARKAETVRDDVAQAVARGARDVERYAAAAGPASTPPVKKAV